MPTHIDKETGKLVIDFADAHELWDTLTMTQKFEFTDMMLEPVLKNATVMRAGLLKIMTMCNNGNSSLAIYNVAKEALPK